MSEHPGDSTSNRFRAFWAGVLAFVSFGVVLWVALKIAPPREVIEPGWAERATERSQNVAEVRAAQAAVLSPEAVKSAMAPTLTALKQKKAAKSDQVIPGSPTFMKQLEQPPAEAPAPAETPKPEAEKPAASAPAPAAAQ